jgi:hypothetical protein
VLSHAALKVLEAQAALSGGVASVTPQALLAAVEAAAPGGSESEAFPMSAPPARVMRRPAPVAAAPMGAPMAAAAGGADARASSETSSSSQGEGGSPPLAMTRSRGA